MKDLEIMKQQGQKRLPDSYFYIGNIYFKEKKFKLAYFFVKKALVEKLKYFNEEHFLVVKFQNLFNEIISHFS